MVIALSLQAYRLALTAISFLVLIFILMILSGKMHLL